MLPKVSAEAVKGVELALWQEIRASQAAGTVVRYERLTRLCAMEPAARCALDAALALALHPAFSAVFQALCGEGACTLDLACRMQDAVSGAPNEAENSVLYRKRLFSRLRLVLRYEEPSTRLFFQLPLRADERLVEYLSGSDAVDLRLRQCVCFLLEGQALAPLFVRQERLCAIEKAIAFKEESAPRLLQLTGNSGTGKKLLLSHACKALGQEMLFVDAAFLLANESAGIRDMIRAILRESLFYEMGICFTGIKQQTCPTQEKLAQFWHLCVLPLLGIPHPICICTDPTIALIPLTDQYLQVLSLPDYHRNERIALWAGFCKLYGLAFPIDCAAAGSKFKLNAAEIRKVVRQLRALEKSGCAALCDQQISRACTQVTPSPAQGSIRRIEAGYTFEDLKLPQEQKQALINICAHVKHRHLVYDQWNMESRYAYGRNVSALLVGPPGTGKTMAVHVISNMLDIPLYRIDLSQVVDKYIGETEKRLEEIFTVAEKNNVILFFDEADSIFGKRSEVNDAKDKYANTEVSYILQRIEQYDGIVILATNYKQNIDEAFMRRMRYLVEFQLPSEALRREIWESSFAAQVPLAEIDFAYLARQFEVAGGVIKNVALNATFLAADAGAAVNMKHILDSLRMENLKIGKPMIKQDFAEYGFLF